MLTTYLFWLILGITIGYLIIAIPKSIYQPGTRKIQAIMFFGKLHTVIANVEGKKIYEGKTIPGGLTKWDLVNLPPNEKERFNLYFFLWPFFKIYTYSLTYTKAKKIGEEEYGDVIIWKNENTKNIVVSRTGISNYLEFRQEYPTVTTKLNTKELAEVTIYTNNIVEVVNPALAFFGINNWFITGTEILNGALRGLVAEKNLYDLNQLCSGEGLDSFSIIMKNSVNKKNDSHPGLGNLGLTLFKSVIKDFDSSDEKTKQLMNSYAEITIAEAKGNAKIKTAEADAKSYGINQAKIVEWKKKFLIDTGLAKVDSNGNIIELVPDANAKIGAEALKELSKLTGTLVLDSEGMNKIFNINK